MRKSLMFVLVLLCMASLVAGMAYTSVNVNTESSITLSAAEEGILAFSHNREVRDADKVFQIDNNKVKMLFGAGNIDEDTNEREFGIQPNSSYQWQDYMELKNNSDEDIWLYVQESDKIKELSDNHVYFTMSGSIEDGDRTNFIENNKAGSDNGIRLAPDEKVLLTVSISAGEETTVKTIDDLGIIFRASEQTDKWTGSYNGHVEN